MDGTRHWKAIFCVDRNRGDWRNLREPRGEHNYLLDRESRRESDAIGVCRTHDWRGAHQRRERALQIPRSPMRGRGLDYQIFGPVSCADSWTGFTRASSTTVKTMCDFRPGLRCISKQLLPGCVGFSKLSTYTAAGDLCDSSCASRILPKWWVLQTGRGCSTG